MLFVPSCSRRGDWVSNYSIGLPTYVILLMFYLEKIPFEIVLNDIYDFNFVDRCYPLQLFGQPYQEFPSTYCPGWICVSFMFHFGEIYFHLISASSISKMSPKVVHLYTQEKVRPCLELFLKIVFLFFCSVKTKKQLESCLADCF